MCDFKVQVSCTPAANVLSARHSGFHQPAYKRLFFNGRKNV